MQGKAIQSYICNGTKISDHTGQLFSSDASNGSYAITGSNSGIQTKKVDPHVHQSMDFITYNKSQGQKFDKVVVKF